MLDLAETVENKIENLRREVHKLDAKIEPMQILECSLRDLKRDKMRLLQDNNELRERNLNLCLITSDLNTRIKDLERERDSFFLFNFATRAGSPQQREPISVSPYYLPTLSTFPVGGNRSTRRKPTTSAER